MPPSELTTLLLSLPRTRIGDRLIMFHFAVPFHDAKLVDKLEGLPVKRDDEFGERVFAGWQKATENRLPADMYPLKHATLYRWEGATPRDHAMCKTLVEAAAKITPHYIWIDSRVKSFRESEVWDLS